MTSIDRVLDVLDNAGQESPEHGYGEILLAEVEPSERAAASTEVYTWGYSAPVRWVAGIEQGCAIARCVSVGAASQGASGLAAALAQMSRDAMMFGAGYAVITDEGVDGETVLGFDGADAEEPPVVLTRRVRRCHHGNPRNACRDCSMGRR